MRTLVSKILSKEESPEKVDWLTSLRESQKKLLLSASFPSKRNEKWKYTSLDNLYKQDLKLPNEYTSNLKNILSQSNELELTVKNKKLYLANGHLNKSLSTINTQLKGLKISQLRDLKNKERYYFSERAKESSLQQFFPRLNLVTFREGLLIETSSDSEIEECLHIIHVGSDEPGSFNSPRLLFKVGNSSKLTVVEEFLDVTSSVTNSVTDIKIEKNAKFMHHRIIRNTDASTHIGTITANVDQEGCYKSDSIVVEGGLTRIDIDVKLEEQNASAMLTGLYPGKNSELIDHHIVVNHKSSNTKSSQLYRGVMNDKSKGIFNGKIAVAKNIYGVDSNQYNNNILLSDTAEVYTKPELEIYSDDVKCAHGATIGELDEQAIFYMRSRGISEADAKDLLLDGFLSEISSNVPVKDLNRLITTKLRAKH